jgi:hypothetical protein
MTDRLLKVWLPGAASCLLFFGFYFVLSLLPFLSDRRWFIGIPYLVLPFLGALAYLSLRMKGSVVERIVAALLHNEVNLVRDEPREPKR